MDSNSIPEPIVTEAEVTAYHEAGHVVIGLFHDFALGCVCLFQDGKPRPRTRWSKVEGEEFPLSTYDIEHVTFMALGGGVSEMLAFDVLFSHPGIQESIECDVKEIAVQLRERKQPSEPEDVIKRLDWSVPRVKLLFDQDPRLVEAMKAVAARLFKAIEAKEECVSGKELTDLVWTFFPE